jgi:hypothetical protein
LEAKYILSRELLDIIHYLVHGLVSLILVYRDHFDTHTPLLPWLHSTENCEHTFREAHKIIKDFTMLDFFYMLTKLHMKLHEAVLQSHSADYKAHANCYCHTYVDAADIDLPVLAQFPTDAKIQEAANDAMEECNSLLVLLGIDPALVCRNTTIEPPALAPGKLVCMMTSVSMMQIAQMKKVMKLPSFKPAWTTLKKTSFLFAMSKTSQSQNCLVQLWLL